MFKIPKNLLPRQEQLVLIVPWSSSRKGSIRNLSEYIGFLSDSSGICPEPDLASSGYSLSVTEMCRPSENRFSRNKNSISLIILH